MQNFKNLSRGSVKHLRRIRNKLSGGWSHYSNAIVERCSEIDLHFKRRRAFRKGRPHRRRTALDIYQLTSLNQSVHRKI